jgi:two-component system sensor kinase FixL
MDDDRTPAASRSQELNEVRWQAILDTVRDAIVCIDEAANVTLFNRAAEAIFGYDAGEVLGRNVRMLMPEPYRGEHDGFLAAYRATGEPKAIGRVREVRAQRKSGEVFPIELSVSEARAGGQVIYSAIIRDTSDRRAMEAELETARRLSEQRERLAAIGAITGRIVHDLGNPLAGLSMQAQLIHRRVNRNPDRPSRDLSAPAERIVAEVRRLDGLIKDFLDFARQQRLKLATVALPALLERVLEPWRPVAAARGITIAFEVGAGVPTLTADQEELRLAFDHLVKNAVEAIEPGPGRVDVVVERRPDDRVRVAISDSGVGVPESVDVFRIFETTKRDGSGLGLPIAKQIVAAHGGQIDFERREPRGTTFYVDLPV